MKKTSKFQRSKSHLSIFGPLCVKCRVAARWFDDHCIDCWPGYDLCKACGDYRCEHILPDEKDLADPEFISCHCGNLECRTGFVEGSTSRIINQAEFISLQHHWNAQTG